MLKKVETNNAFMVISLDDEAQTQFSLKLHILYALESVKLNLKNERRITHSMVKKKKKKQDQSI